MPHESSSPQRCVPQQLEQLEEQPELLQRDDQTTAHLAKFSYLALLQGDFLDYLSQRAVEHAEGLRKKQLQQEEEGHRLRGLVGRYRRLVMRRRAIEELRAGGYGEEASCSSSSSSWGGATVATVRGLRWALLGVLLAVCVNLDLQRVVPAGVGSSAGWEWESSGRSGLSAWTGSAWPPVAVAQHLDTAVAYATRPSSSLEGSSVPTTTATRPPTAAMVLPTALEQQAQGFRSLEDAILSSVAAATAHTPSISVSATLPGSPSNHSALAHEEEEEMEAVEVSPSTLLPSSEGPAMEPAPETAASEAAGAASSTEKKKRKKKKATAKATSKSSSSSSKSKSSETVPVADKAARKAMLQDEPAVEASVGTSSSDKTPPRQTARQLAQGAALRLYSLPRLLRQWCFFPAVHLQTFNQRLSSSSMPWRRRRATEEAMAAVLTGSELVTRASAKHLQLSRGMSQRKLEQLYQRAFVDEDMTLFEVLAECGIDQLRRSMELRWLRLQEWLRAVIEDVEEEDARLRRTAIGCELQSGLATPQEQLLCWLRNLWRLVARHSRRVIVKSGALHVVATVPFPGQQTASPVL